MCVCVCDIRMCVYNSICVCTYVHAMYCMCLSYGMRAHVHVSAHMCGILHTTGPIKDNMESAYIIRASVYVHNTCMHIYVYIHVYYIRMP